MKSLINKICLVLSIIAGAILGNVLFAGTIGGFWSLIISGLFFGTIIKTVVFPEEMIKQVVIEMKQDVLNKIIAKLPEIQKMLSTEENQTAQAPVQSENLPAGRQGISNIPIQETNTKSNIQENQLENPQKRSFMDMILNTGEGEIANNQDPTSGLNSLSSGNLTPETDVQVPEELKNFGETPIIEQVPKEQKNIYTPPVYEQSKLWLYIKNFFAENTLAKIGGILLFLGAMFFVGLIYIGVGGVGKLIIGLIFGLVVYVVGIYLDKKDLKAESQICLGVGVAINYLVIIAGRYYNFDGQDIIIGQTAAFIFLLLNTLLAVVTGVIYRSNTIIVFGFLLAYLSPVLVGGKADNPYFVSTYAAVVSLGAIGLSRYLSSKNSTEENPDNIIQTNKNGITNISYNLLRIGFLGGIFTFVAALISFPNFYLSQIIYISIIGIATIISAYIDKNNNNILNFTIGTFASILIAMFVGFDYITEPFSLSIYMAILFAAIIYISRKIEDIKVSNILLAIGFISTMIMIISLPFVGTFARIFKIIMIALVGLVSIYIGSNSQKTAFTVGVYISVLVLMMSGAASLGADFSGFVIYISYILTFVAIAGSALYLAKKSEDENNNLLLFSNFIPLVGVILFLFAGLVNFLIPTMLFGIAIISASIFLFIDKIDKYTKYILLIGLGIYILTISGFMNVVSSGISMYHNIHISNIEIIFTTIVSFALLITSYGFSKKDDLEGLFPAATLMHILILLPIIHSDTANLLISIISICATLVVNIGFPIISKKSNNIEIIIGLIIGALFVGGEIYRFDMIQGGLVYGGQSVTGIIYIVLALVYLLPGILLIGEKSDNTSDISNRNTIYAYMGIGISSISIALAFIFANNISVLALSWISLGAILMYIYSRVNDDKVYIGSLILYAIGLVKMVYIFDLLKVGDFSQLVPLGIIFILFIVGLYCIRNKTDDGRAIYDVGQSIGIGMIIFMIDYISGGLSVGQSLCVICGIMLVIGGIYSRFYTGYSKYIYIIALMMLAGFQLILIGDTLNSSGLYNFSTSLPQYIATVLISASAYIYYRSNEGIINDILLVVISLYLFIITTIFVDNIFANTFAISICRGLVAYAALHRGIAKDQIKFRTIGLYIIGITLAKVAFYDIWYGINSGLMRVVALMVLGGLLIYISTLYTRKYGGKMSGELNPSNLWSKEKTQIDLEKEVL